MSMNKKDFIAIADALRNDLDNLRPDDRTLVVGALCGAFRQQNHNFNSDRFCGYLDRTCGPCGGRIKEPPPPEPDDD